MVTFNAKKNETVLFSLKPKNINHAPLHLNNETIREVETHTHLGLTLNCNDKWDQHVSNIVAKANYSLTALRKLKNYLDKITLEKIYFTYVRPIMEYSSIVWDNCTVAQSFKLEQVQLDAAQIITGAVKGTKHRLLFKETGWQTLSERRENSQLVVMYKMLNNLAPQYLSLLVSKPRQSQYTLRGNNRIPTIYAKTNIFMNSFLPRTISNWNALLQQTKLATSPESFKSKIKKQTKPPTYYNSGTRKGQILHAKLRMECSDLNHHLVTRHIQENSTVKSLLQAAPLLEAAPRL